MFRKPKRPNKATLRRQDNDDDDDKGRGDVLNSDDEDDVDTSQLLAEARNHKKLKPTTTSRSMPSSSADTNSNVLHTFASSSQSTKPSEKDLAVSSAAHHSVSATSNPPPESVGFGSDGIFRDTTRNKFHAGPIRASQNVRVTARFDYQPDICKDYKQTGFCGFGDTCIYLHDRGDTLSGWQLEEQWQQQQDAKKKQQEAELDAYLKGQEAGGQKAAAIKDLENDGLPFACHLCRSHFVEPVVTNCLHYFCQGCILKHVRETGEACPICGKDTFGVFNEPIKLMAKKRKILGAGKAKEEGSWKAYYDFFQGKSEESE